MRNFNSILLNSFFNDRLIKFNAIFSVFLNLLVWLFLVWQYPHFSDLMALHYNIYFGIDLLGPRIQIFLIPLAGLISLLLNSFIGSLIYVREKILSYFLLGFSSLLQLLLAVSALTIVLVNL